MLAEIMLILQILRRCLNRGIHHHREYGHVCCFVQHQRIFNRFLHIASPCKGTVFTDQHRRHSQWVEMPLPERLNNDLSGIDFIAAFDFFRQQMACTGHRPVKVVGMGGSIAGQFLLCLRKSRGIAGVGVDNAAYPLKVFVNLYVCGQV